MTVGYRVLSVRLSSSDSGSLTSWLRTAFTPWQVVRQFFGHAWDQQFYVVLSTASTARQLMAYIYIYTYIDRHTYIYIHIDIYTHIHIAFSSVAFLSLKV